MKNKNNFKNNAALKILLVLGILIIAGAINDNINEKNQASPNQILNKANAIINFLSIEEISIVSAGEVCCEKVSGGGWCVEADSSECDGSFDSSPSQCKMTEFCKLGWCLDGDGWCSPGSPQRECKERKKGQWSENPGPECDMGCCDLYENTQYTTRKACEISSGEFDDSKSESDCKFLTQDEGACIINAGCEWATDEKCYTEASKRGLEVIDFQKGVFCTNEELENEYGYDYKPNSSKLCVDGYEDVYWQDDHANREGIAIDCKEGEETCSINSNGEYYCKSISCVDEKGNKRVNTESWCKYDAYVGDSRDYVGSEHCQLYCNNGEIKVECSEWRNKICTEKVDPATGISTAKLRDNLWKECFAINNIDKCNNHPGCRIVSVDVDKYFKFSACVPKYPPGFDIYSKDTQENGEDICALANIDCLQVWDDDAAFLGAGDDDLEANKRCSDPSYYQLQMHNFCTSLGDCGSSFNYKGNYTRNNEETWWRALYFAERVCKDIVRDPVRYCVDNGLNQRECDEAYYGCLDFLADFENSKDKFELLGGDYPQWLGDIQTRSDGGITSIELINSLIAGREPAVGNDYWENQGIGDAGGSPDIYYETFSFTCSPSQLPIGATDCGKCNNDSLIKCTKYRCHSLGDSCEILKGTEDSTNPLCIDRFISRSDTIPPQISFGAISQNYKVTPGENGVSISLTDGTCPEKYSTISFTLNTNEYAKCFTSTEISELSEGLNGKNDYNTTHFIEKNLGIDNKLRLYTICRDVAGNPNTKEYVVDICISPYPNKNVPVIQRFIPEDRSYLAFGETKKRVTLKINEPATCRYARVPNVDYENMSFFCDSETEGIGPYSCSADLTGLTNPENSIYFRCNDSYGNFHMRDIVYTLLQTKERLKINIESPINGSVRETPINANNPLILKAKTSGGVNGVSHCSYEFLDREWGKAEFFKTDSNIHEQEFNTGALTNGNYNIKVKCEDAVGNKAESVVSFSINIDEGPPIIINKNLIGATMTLTTDEPAECVYNTTSCNYLFEDSSNKDISFGRTTTHEINDFNKRLDYYVRCRDEFKNEGCTKIEATEQRESNPPEVVRVFYDSDYSGDLKLITNEDAQCSFKKTTCSFEYAEGEPMTRRDGKKYSTEHYADWNLNTQYHIKCIDSWGNPNVGCLIVVEPFRIIEIGG